MCLLVRDTEHRLLDAAGQVFADKGFQAATVREILRRAGVKNLAAVNYHYGDKEHLYAAVVGHLVQQHLRHNPLPSWPPGTPAAIKLRDFIRDFVRRVVVVPRPDWPARLLMRELAQPTAACVEFVRQFVRPNFELLLGIVNEVLPADTPEVRRHQVVFSIISQCLHYRLARPVLQLLVGEEEFLTLDAERVADHVIRFSLAALGLEAPL